MRILSLIISISVVINFVHAVSPGGSSNKQQAVDIRPIFHGLKKRTTLVKRDYATTLQYLHAAMASYRKDAVTPPSAKFAQLDQNLPPSPSSPPPAPEQQDSQHLDSPEPPSPYLGITPEQSSNEVAATPESGDKSAEKALPIKADIEEDDIFDPEEDPDDVDDPPIVNGVPVEREE
ncbi:hypothetical protein INT46_000329 [Mucor plumbeus]|uniref:Uncharacterized protein n=1 Tax=Mucor plumbeus TaxID=97098 RepID=A0A8H7V5F6_9FUNG|nr:hypothetical protein INT46_000329 [Mucor plumbeus]